MRALKALAAQARENHFGEINHLTVIYAENPDQWSGPAPGVPSIHPSL